MTTRAQKRNFLIFFQGIENFIFFFKYSFQGLGGLRFLKKNYPKTFR